MNLIVSTQHDSCFYSDKPNDTDQKIKPPLKGRQCIRTKESNASYRQTVSQM